MNRRRFLNLIAGAAAAIGLSRVAPAAEQRMKVKPDLPPRKLVDLYPNGMTVFGDGTGKQWILDPTCPRDSVYYYTRARFDLQAHGPLKNGPIQNITVLEDTRDAL